MALSRMSCNHEPAVHRDLKGHRVHAHESCLFAPQFRCQQDAGGVAMSSPERFNSLTNRLIANVRAREGLAGLVLLGSASEGGEHRRDEWSDHDFFAIIEEGRGSELRAALDWLPDSENVVLSAREGGIGFVAVYGDGHVFEFALAEASELVGVVVGDATVVADNDSGVTAKLVAAGQADATAGDTSDPENEARLFLVKILIGMGRINRGEVLNGGQFIRTWAVNHLLRAIRARFPGEAPDARDKIDPTRRFEKDYPAWASEITLALNAPADEAARNLFTLARRILEPDWDEFPTLAAEAIARRLGWRAVPT